MKRCSLIDDDSTMLVLEIAIPDTMSLKIVVLSSLITIGIAYYLYWMVTVPGPKSHLERPLPIFSLNLSDIYYHSTSGLVCLIITPQNKDN